jgi:hypothetical protein
MSLNDADQQRADQFNWGYELLIDGVVALVPGSVVAILIAPNVTAWGSSPVLVFLGTLALSLGAFFIALLIRQVNQVPSWLMLLLAAGALFVAGSLATMVGQDSPALGPPLLSPTHAGAYAIAYALACWNIFGPLGFALSTASGIYLSWRARKLYERFGS